MVSTEKTVRERDDNGKGGDSEWMKRAEEAFGDAVREGTAFIKKHPVTAVALGFGLGFLFGAFLRRRD